MRSRPALPLLAALAIALSGCGAKVHLPFRFQLAPRLAAEAASARTAGGPVALRFLPRDFPQRVDVHGADGFIGAIAKTRLPVGVALTTRVREYLEAAVGVEDGAARVVTIEVVEARTEYAFSARTKRQSIDRARCSLRVEVDDGVSRWSEAYFSSDEQGGKPSTQTEVLDGVWDEVGAALARDVVRRLAPARPPGPEPG